MKKLIGCLVAMMLLGALVQMAEVQAATVLSMDDMSKITAGKCTPIKPGPYGGCGSKCKWVGYCTCPDWGCVGRIFYESGGHEIGDCVTSCCREAPGCVESSVNCCTGRVYENVGCKGSYRTHHEDTRSCL